MKILHEENSKVDISTDLKNFVKALTELDQMYEKLKEAVKILQNIEFTATYGIKLPDLQFFDKRSQTDVLEGIVNDPPTEDEVDYFKEVTKNLLNLLK